MDNISYTAYNAKRTMYNDVHCTSYTVHCGRWHCTSNNVYNRSFLIMIFHTASWCNNIHQRTIYTILYCICTLYTVHCTLHCSVSVHWKVYTVHCTVYTRVKPTVCLVRNTLYSVSITYTLYNVQCTFHCSAYTIHCTPYSV